jgi:hypothetical protein
MTILILDHPVLDHPAAALPPYQRWLSDSGEDLVLVTGRAPDAIAAADRGDYASISYLAGYPVSTAVERAVLELAERTAVSAIVAIAHADLIRAGALRDYLRLPGQGRDSALVCADLVAMRQRLAEWAIPVIPSGSVRRAVDLYWYAHRWGYPIRVRQRRAAGWPVVRVADNEAQLIGLTAGLFQAGFDSVPSLLLEPQLSGTRTRAVMTGTAAVPLASPAEQAVPLELLTSATSAIPGAPGSGRAVSVVRGEDGGWLVDSVSAELPDEESRRQLVRSQAGLIHTLAASR